MRCFEDIDLGGSGHRTASPGLDETFPEPSLSDPALPKFHPFGFGKRQDFLFMGDQIVLDGIGRLQGEEEPARTFGPNLVVAQTKQSFVLEGTVVEFAIE